ncbi:MAG: hypothetical protein KAV00_12640, partial [Phycisphaerae bacterium]|nr:hypothetical protein [Phycisphaerae bacterium]
SYFFHLPKSPVLRMNQTIQKEWLRHYLFHTVRVTFIILEVTYHAEDTNSFSKAGIYVKLLCVLERVSLAPVSSFPIGLLSLSLAMSY